MVGRLHSATSKYIYLNVLTFKYTLGFLTYSLVLYSHDCRPHSQSLIIVLQVYTLTHIARSNVESDESEVID